MFKGQTKGFKKWFREGSNRCKKCGERGNIVYDYNENKHFCGFCGEIQ